MKAAAMLFALLLGLAGSAAVARAQCEVGCAQECKQEDAVCRGEATFSAKVNKADCAAAADEALLECEGANLDARTDCIGLCGADLSACAAEAKAGLKTCKEAVKPETEACKAEVAASLALDKAACADDLAGCLDFCAGE